MAAAVQQQPQNNPVQAQPSRFKFNATEIGYFDRDLDLTYGKGDCVTVGREVYYRDVRLFVVKFKDVAESTGGIDEIRINLAQCL